MGLKPIASTHTTRAGERVLWRNYTCDHWTVVLLLIRGLSNIYFTVVVDDERMETGAERRDLLNGVITDTEKILRTCGLLCLLCEASV